MKFSNAIAAAIVTINVAASTRPPCNPAIHCPALSTECFSCNPRLDSPCETRDINDPTFRDKGLCVEPKALNFKGLVFRQPYDQRCRRIVDFGYKTAPKTEDVSPENYVKACREYEYTCNDGTCKKVKGLPSKCNRAECGPLRRVWRLHYQNRNKNICKKHGGIRFDYLRCDNPNFSKYGDGTGVQSTCEDGQAPLEYETCEPGRLGGISRNTDAFPIGADACHETCTARDLGSVLPCCHAESLAGICENTAIDFPELDNRDREPEGFLLNLKMNTEEDVCCCEVECTCFGDPHCNSFFGDFEITQANVGDYDFFSVNGFVSHAYLSDLGIVDYVDVDIPAGGDQQAQSYRIDATACTNGQGIWDNTNNEYVKSGGSIIQYQEPAGDLPSALEPVIVALGDSVNEIVFEARCIYFLIKNNWESRLDITAKAKTNALQSEEEDPSCCPDQDTVYTHLDGQGATGFCVRTKTERGFYLPGVDPALNQRRLERAEKVEQLRPGRSIKQKLSNKVLNARNLDIVVNGDATECAEICQEYEDNNLLPFPLQQCIANCIDFGADSIRAARNENGCHNLANDDVFNPANKQECDEGLMLQYKSKSGGAWEDLLFFNSETNICDDEVKILFNHIEIDGQPMDGSLYDFQLQYCYPSDNCKGHSCDANVGFEVLGLDVLYTCGTTEIFKELLELATTNCACTQDVAQCINNCVNNGDCPDDCPP